MANVLGELFSDIAGAIRTKNGETGTMKPNEFASKILAIETSPENACYITFMSYDGSETYGVKAVYSGDDSADPIKMKLFDTPTKESTAAENFTFAGWSLSANGDVDETALDDVTEDRTVYAAFDGTVRYYTVRFYDGDTILASHNLAYGSIPSIDTPTKDGYSFTEWQPAIGVVTGDKDYYAQWSEKVTFAGGTWEEIATISEAGEAANYFSIGDTKTITIDGTDIILRLIGFDHDTLSDGTGKAGMTIVAETPLSPTMAVSNWNTLASDMKTKLKPLLPSDLQSVIKPVVKECDVDTVNAVVVPVNVEFELFPLSFEECGIKTYGNRKYTNSDWKNYFTPLGTIYEYFSKNYNSTYYGPFSTFLYKSLGCWYRQWARFGPVTGLFSQNNMSGTSLKYANAASDKTSLRTVMMAFCI